nr:hypothetical protein CFP56_74500 [Quercus suber]
MDSLSKSCFLSREDEVELAWSNNKVKYVHHADFKISQGEGPHQQYRDDFSTRNVLSFKDKLLGEILGAYNQAFELDGHMDAEDDSDDEITKLRESVAAVTLSRKVKQRIKAPWENSLIVKVYGRVVGYHFLQARLLALWKLTGKLDFIDLRKEFYLI